jgi:hypothetical protein
LAIINPDRIASQRPAVQTAAPPPAAEEEKAEEKPAFKIVDDEGC